MNKREQILQEMFRTVYAWGRVGLVTDENCKTFQSYIKDLEALNQPQEGGMGWTDEKNKEHTHIEQPQEEIEEISCWELRNETDKSAICFLVQKLNEHTRAINKLNEVIRKINKQ